jgi:hypothetical protein
MSTKERLAALEHAHRALHARHEALTIMCRILFPLINVSPALKRQMTTRAYDVMNDLLDERNLDENFQSIVREAMDELTNVILADD